MYVKYFTRLIVIILLLVYAGAFAQKGIGVTDLSQDDSIPYNKFVRYLKEKGKPPTEYVIEKLKKYDIVMIGEDHWLKDHPRFIDDLIKAIHADGNSVGLDWLAIEFGYAGDQTLADEFIASPTYREDLAICILQNGPDFCGWPYQEVLDIFRIVWDENKKHPENRAIKILLTNSPYRLVTDSDRFDRLEEPDKEFLTSSVSRDSYMARVLEKYVIANDQKAIYYAGGAHSTYMTRGYAYDEETGNCLRYLPAGLLLKILYPRLVFSIELYGANKDRSYYPGTNPEEWDRYLDGRMDEIFRRNGNIPIGFDITEPPFSNIRESDYYMFWERGNRENFKKNFPKCFEKIGNTSDRKISESNDGLIFLKPLYEYEGATVCEKFFDDAFMERISRRRREKIKTKRELYEFLLKIRPIMETSLTELIDKEE